MATNYIQPGKVLAFTAPYQRNSGEGALIGSIFVVALGTVANAATGQFATSGVWTLTKLNTDVFTEGVLVYWDNTNKRCTVTATGNTRIGVAIAAAANPTTTGKVYLNGTGAPTGA